MEYPKREILGPELYEALKKRLVELYQGSFEVNAGEDEGEVIARKLYLEDQAGCVPDEILGEELLYAIKSKYYEFFAVIKDRLQKEYIEKKKIRHHCISIFVDQSFEDTTAVVITFRDAELFEHTSKAWNFIWPSLAELQKEMTDTFYQMQARLNQYFLEGLRYEK